MRAVAVALFYWIASAAFVSAEDVPKLITSGSTAMKLTLIPAGVFQMGSSISETERRPDEGPQHSVRISQSFYMGVYEVTQGEYKDVMGGNPSHFQTDPPSDWPVETVSWFDAIDFCNELSTMDGRTPYYTMRNVVHVFPTFGVSRFRTIKSASVSVAGGNGYRLPTEAEWEYACRASTKTVFHFGSTQNGDKANSDGRYPYGTEMAGKYLEHPSKNGSYYPNSFGLFDMHGNVCEWCFDIYDNTVYQARSGTTVDPLATKGIDRRVMRGGSWNSDSRETRSAARYWNTPDYRAFTLGFRVACAGVR